MVYAKMGDKVKVHYTGKLADGSVFDTSEEREPLLFTVGEGSLIPGFEQAVIGMTPGGSKTQHIPASLAYGPRMEELVRQFDRNDIPDEVDLEVGGQLYFRLPDDNTLTVTVLEISDSSVTLDANHPLAGQDLTFTIELIEIV